MDRPALLAIVIAFMALLLVLMFLGWRARTRRQSGIPSPQAAPRDLGRVWGAFEGQYVATTKAEDPLDRIAVGGLGFRARAVVTVAEAGVVIGIPGKTDPFIPATAARDLRDATWTIDRAVEEGGLQVIGWTLGDTAVDSYFRMLEPKAFTTALRSMLDSTPTKDPS